MTLSDGEKHRSVELSHFASEESEMKLAQAMHEVENGISDYISQIDVSRALKNVLPRAQ